MTKKITSLLLIGLALAADVAAGPVIQMSEEEFNFGKAVQQATYRHVFWVKSVGDDTLRIEQVRAGCGCTQTPLTDSTLAPGDSARFEIIFDSKRFRGLTEKKSAIVSNATNGKMMVGIVTDLSLEAEDMRPLVIQPYRVDVSQFTEAPRRRSKIQVENRSDQNYELSLVDAYDLNFDIEMPKKIKAGETAEITILVHEDKIEEEFRQSFTFQLNDGRGTRYSIPVKRDVRIPGQ